MAVTLPTTHTVKKNDCLWALAKTYYGKGSLYTRIAKANKIDSPYTIYVGQKLTIPDENGNTGSGGGNTSTDMTKAEVTSFGLMSTSETENELFAMWNWDKESTTESYKYVWSYYKEVKVGSKTEVKEFLESVSSNSVDKDYYATSRFCSYTIPEGAVKVRFRVLPVAKTETINNKETTPWEAKWSDYSEYECKENDLGKPSAPDPQLDELTKSRLTAILSPADADALGTKTVQFQLEKNYKIIETTKNQTINTESKRVSYEWGGLDPDSIYRVRCRAVEGGIYGQWSDWSAEVNTVPAAPASITKCTAIGSDKVFLEWSKVSSATGYDIEYTTNKIYFDASNETQSSSTSGSETRTYLSNIEPGREYFFRVRATNSNGESDWTEIVSLVLGTTPAAPTTWSSTTTATVGEDVVLYWVHNSNDGSTLSYSQIELETVKSNEYYKVIYADDKYTKTNTIVSVSNGKLVNNAYVGGLKVYSYVDASGETAYYCEDAEISTIEMTNTRYLVTDTDGDGVYTRTDTVVNVTGKTVVEGVFTTDGDTVYRGSDAAGNIVYYCEDRDNTTQSYTIDTSVYYEGVTLRWRVRTAGITNTLGDWSTQRAIDIYKEPELSMKVTGTLGGTDEIETIESFPFYISAVPDAGTQQPLGYHLEVISEQIYETVDRLGNPMTVNEGDVVYSKYFDTEYDLSLIMSAGNIDLENEMGYTFSCTVTMNSGLTASAKKKLGVKWTESRYIPNAQITIDQDTYVAYIKPYCEERTITSYAVSKNEATGEYVRGAELTLPVYPLTSIQCKATKYGRRYTLTDTEVFITTGEAVQGDIQDGNQIYYGTAYDDSENGGGYYKTYYYNKRVAPDAVTTTGEQVIYGVRSDGENIYYCEITTASLIEDVTLSVYRREFDGSFTELSTNLDNTYGTTITDPHPALDYARYRIVATDRSTGSVGYNDLPGYPTGCNAVIIQWDEAWTNFEASATDELAQPPWSGSLLKLPYNIDVSDRCKPDVSLIKYIGREHPVSYYGTHLDFTANWSTSIDKQDKETIYALRRLQRWTGDVYVREPSGTGYWANIGVSFSQKHCETTIPVELEITRVEGGI